MKRSLFLSIAFIAILMIVNWASAQQNTEDMQQKLAAIKQSSVENQAALRQYQWIETTQVAMKGEVKSTTQKSCYYGNDGTVEKVPLASSQPQQQEQSGGGRHPRLKAKIVENKKEELTEYMQKAVALVHQYVPPSPEKMQTAFQAGNVTINPAAGPGIVSLIFKDYQLPGDSMTFSIVQASKKMANLNVKTYLEDVKDAVTLNVMFSTLADGTSFAGQTVLDVSAKNLQVTISNTDYRKLGQ